MASAIEMTTCLEESEPLNENGRSSIKMQDAPFQDSRAGSEEDMLEYDDDETIFNCDVCRRRRRMTSTEKCLAASSVIFLIVIIVLGTQLGKKDEKKVAPKCESKGCLAAASALLETMDPTADPCEDFHQYACGGWLKETPIPPGFQMWDRFQELAYKNLFLLKNFIETHEMLGEAPQKVRVFYESCMAESQVPRQATLNEFKSLIANVTITGNGFLLEETLNNVHRLNSWPLFQVMIGPDERDPQHHIIKIEAGHSPFPYGIFKEKEPPTAHELKERSSNHTRNDSSEGFNATDASEVPSTVTDGGGFTHVPGNVLTNGPDGISPGTTEKPHIKSTHPHPLANMSELVQTYLRETTLLLQVLMNRTRQEAEREAELILELEKKLSLAHDIDLHIHNRTQAYNMMKTKVLQSKCDMISWAPYLERLLGSERKHINEQTVVVVLHERALIQVCSIVHEYSSNTTLKRVLENYIKLAVVKSFKAYFDMSTFDKDMNADQELEADGEHWRRCTFYTNRAFGLATGSVYVNATSADVPLTQITDLVDHVKRAFKDFMLRKIWLDKQTRANAEEKIDEMIEKVSYPTFILNQTFLDNFYNQFKVGSNWFQNLLNWREFTLTNMVRTLSEQFDRTSSWINPPVTVESDYSAVRNDIIFPIALFHLPIYSYDGPSALNFGALGSVIGHEITHAFDILGRQYDGYGRLRDWWDPVTAELFNETTTCMKEQYDLYKIGNLTINGDQTLEENIADNGGIRAAYVAYELWVRDHGEEIPLAGIDLDYRQIFYISFAQMYCSKWKAEGIKDFLVRDPHSPGPYRILGALSNSLTFQDIFKCPYVAKYNPSKKCLVW